MAFRPLVIRSDTDVRHVCKKTSEFRTKSLSSDSKDHSPTFYVKVFTGFHVTGKQVPLGSIWHENSAEKLDIFVHDFGFHGLQYLLLSTLDLGSPRRPHPTGNLLSDSKLDFRGQLRGEEGKRGMKGDRNGKQKGKDKRGAWNI